MWSPGFLDGFSMSLDWWKIDIEDPIQAVGIQQAIDDCYRALPANRDRFACSLITRYPVTGDVADVNATLTNQIRSPATSWMSPSTRRTPDRRCCWFTWRMTFS